MKFSDRPVVKLCNEGDCEKAQAYPLGMLSIFRNCMRRKCLPLGGSKTSRIQVKVCSKGYFRMGSEEKEFQCLRCGKCCSWGGYVRISSEEADRIAEYLGITPEDFIDRYTKLATDRQGLSIAESEPGVCIFLEDPPACRINSVKPEQCKRFPRDWSFPGWRKLCAGGKKESIEDEESDDPETK